MVLIKYVDEPNNLIKHNVEHAKNHSAARGWPVRTSGSNLAITKKVPKLPVRTSGSPSHRFGLLPVRTARVCRFAGLPVRRFASLPVRRVTLTVFAEYLVFSLFIQGFAYSLVLLIDCLFKVLPKGIAFPIDQEFVVLFTFTLLMDVSTGTDSP